MLGRFFNSFYYGKSGKGDYTPENLPQNRVQLFFEVLRVRWSAMVRLNLLYVLFWLPAIIWTGWNYLALENVLGMVAAGEILESQLGDHIMSLFWMWLLILWPCIAITGPATAGVSYVTRNWARDQHSFMMSDFKDAFKANWKQSLIISTITGLLPVIVFVCYRFYGGMAATNGVLFVIPQMLVVILAVIWMLSLQLIYTLMVTYDLSFGNLLRNSFILAIGKLPMSIVIRLVTLAIPVIGFLLYWFIPSIGIYVILVLALYYLLFGFVFSRLVYASFANSVCEKYINPKIEGAPVNMGLRQTTDDDYEIDPTLPQPKRDDQDEEKTD